MILAQFVCLAFGSSTGMLKDIDPIKALHRLWDVIRTARKDGSPVMLIGEAVGHIGVCRHRALLFKYLADHSCLFPEQWSPITTSSAVASSAASAASASTSASAPDASASASEMGGDLGIRAGIIRGNVEAGQHMWVVVLDRDQRPSILELNAAGSNPIDIIPLNSAGASLYIPASPTPVSSLLVD